MATLKPFSLWEVVWFHWEPHGRKGILGHWSAPKRSKPVKKWLSYGYFPPGRLCDSIENHMGQKAILGCSFVPKIYKIGQEMAELWLFSHWEVSWFHWEPNGTEGHPCALICAIKIQNRSRNGWGMAISPLKGCVIPLRTTWDKRGSLGIDLYQQYKELVNKWLSYGNFSPERLCDSI